MALNLLNISNDIIIDQSGEISYLTPDSLYVYNSNAIDPIGFKGKVILNNSDLGEPSIDKLLNRIDVDYKGTISFDIYYDGIFECTLTPANASTRVTTWLDIPLVHRKPFQKFYIVIRGKFGTILYGLEIDFQALSRRRYN